MSPKKSPADEFKANQEDKGLSKAEEKELEKKMAEHEAEEAKAAESTKKRVATRNTAHRSPQEKLEYFHAAVPPTTAGTKVLFGLAGEKFTVADLRLMFAGASSDRE